MQLYLSVNSSGSDTGSEHSARDSCDIEENLHVQLGGSEKAISAPDLSSFGARISALFILSPRLFGVLRFLRNWGEQKEVTRLL